MNYNSIFLYLIIAVNNFIYSSKSIAILSDWGLECGIAMYSEHLSNALTNKKFKIFKYKHNIDLNTLLNNLKKQKIKLLNIQHDPGLFPDVNKLLQFIKQAQKNKIKIVCTVHDERPAFKSIYNSADRCLYHKSPKHIDHSRYKIIDMPIPIFDKNKYDKSILRTKYGFNPDDKIIVTTGFIVEPKRLPDILISLMPHLKSNPNIKIQFLNAITHRLYEHCINEANKLNNVINKYELHNQVFFTGKFLSLQEMQERMFLSDVGFTWFDWQIDSISATEREFISTRIPFVVNDNGHFNLNSGVIKTPTNINSFVISILELLNNMNLQNRLKIEIEATYNKLNYNSAINKYIKALVIK